MLVLLYHALDGDNWNNKRNWLSEEPISQWYGVTTNRSGRDVTRLTLSNNNLRGAIPPELGSLANLERLDLSDNRLNGVILAELGNLPYLEDLSLTGNERLHGCLPEESYIQYCLPPRNVRAVWNAEGTQITLTWDTVERATHYDIYWRNADPPSRFSVTSPYCLSYNFLQQVSCDRIAQRVTETRYVHTTPRISQSKYNYYTIQVCNSYGCSSWSAIGMPPP